MLLNHARLPVWEWRGGESRCPDCLEELTARRGEVNMWHWAHRPAGHARPGACACEESEWHLLWKSAYLSLPGWRVEEPVTVAGARYRLDAVNPATGAVREFVHSLSDAYMAKHAALAGAGLDVMWLMDGSEFASARRSHARGRGEGGWRRLLKPRAAMLHALVGVRVHLDGHLWKEWRNDVWYKMEGEAAMSMLTRYWTAFYADADRRHGAAK
jgi:hypothetical protein